jgi:hypothetical protein
LGLIEEVTMAPRVGGDKVKAGFYWNPTEWEMVTISGESGGSLPGSPDTRYYRVPVLAMLLAAPVMGALFVIFLPFIGIALFLRHLATQAAAATRRAAHGFMATVSPSWRPGEAYLAGRHEEGSDEKATPHKDAQLDALEQEIDQRDGDKR